MEPDPRGMGKIERWGEDTHSEPLAPKGGRRAIIINLTRRMRDLIIEMNLDKVLALVGLVVALLLTVFSVVVLRRPVYAVFGVLLAITCTSWFLLRRGRMVEEARFVQKRSLVYALGTLFFVIFLVTIAIYYLRPEPYSRPILYFVLTSIMAGIVAIEVLVTPLSRKYLLLMILQVLILGFSIELTQIFMFPDVVGIDPAIHQGLVRGIVFNGFLTSGVDYSTTPLFQIAIAIGSLIGGLDYKTSSALIITFTEIVLPPLSVFLFGRFLFNDRVGLMAALLLSVAPYHIYFGIWAVPNTLAVLTVPIILYLLLKIRKERGLTSLLLAVLLMTALILTHPVVAMGLSILLFAIWAVEWSYRLMIFRGAKPSVSLLLALFFSVFMFGWWTYVGNQIIYIGTQIFGGFQIEYLSNVPSTVSNYVYDVPLVEQSLRYLGMFVFFSLALIGCFYLISKRYRNLNRLIIVVISLIPLAAGFVSLAFALTGLDARWFYMTEVIIAVPMAFGLIALFVKLGSRAISGALIIIVVSSVTFLAMASPSGSIDNHDLFPSTGIRFAFTQSELSGGSFLAQTWDGPFASDFDYSTDS